MQITIRRHSLTGFNTCCRLGRQCLQDQPFGHILRDNPPPFDYQALVSDGWDMEGDMSLPLRGTGISSLSMSPELFRGEAADGDAQHFHVLLCPRLGENGSCYHQEIFEIE